MNDKAMKQSRMKKGLVFLTICLMGLGIAGTVAAGGIASPCTNGGNECDAGLTCYKNQVSAGCSCANFIGAQPPPLCSGGASGNIPSAVPIPNPLCPTGSAAPISCTPAQSQCDNGAWQNNSYGDLDSCCADANATVAPITCVTTFQGLVDQFTGYIGGIAASLCVLMLIIAGGMFVFSAGNEGRIANARRIAILAVVGLGIVLAGTVLVQIIKTFLGAS
jgi:hypothetical protein